MARTWLLATIAMGMGCSGQPTSSSSSPSGPGPDAAAPAIDAQAALPPFDPEISKRWTWQECGTIASDPVVLRAKYAPDGKTVAIQFEDGSIVLKSPERLATGVKFKAASGDFAFSRDGSRLAVLGAYPSIYQTSDGALVATMSDPAGQVCGTDHVAISDHGDDVLQFGSSSPDRGQLCVWHVADAKLTAVVTQTADALIVSAAFLGAQGEATRIVIARGSYSGDVRIHDLDGNELSNVTLATASSDEQLVNNSLYQKIAVSPTGEAIAGWAAATTDKLTAVVWDSRDGHALFRKEGAKVNTLLTFSPDGGMVALDDAIFETVGFQRVGDGLPPRIEEPSLSPRGDAAAWAADDYAGIYETKSQYTRLITATPNPTDPGGFSQERRQVSSLDITQDGRTLLVGAAAAVRWQLADRFADSEPTLVGVVPLEGSVHISPDGRFAATAGDGRLLFDLVKGPAADVQFVPPPAAYSDCVWMGLRFSPDSRWVAGPGYGKFVEVYDTEDYKKLAKLDSVGCNTKVVFSTDNRFLYTSRHEQFDTTDWHRVSMTSIDEKLGPIDDVDISSRGTLITSVCQHKADNVDPSCITNYGGDVPALTAPHPKISSEGNWVVAGGTLYHSPTNEVRVFDPEARVSIFTPNGDIVSGRRDRTLVRYCRSEHP